MELSDFDSVFEESEEPFDSGFSEVFQKNLAVEFEPMPLSAAFCELNSLSDLSFATVVFSAQQAVLATVTSG